MRPAPTAADFLRRSRLAGGMALICLLAVAETVVAHQARPNPLSVWVWAVLGCAGALALVAALWFRHCWKQAQRTQTLTPGTPAAEPAGTAPP
jgi:hypothetical protein